MTAAIHLAVAAAMLPTTLADNCDSLYQTSIDICGSGYVSSGRALANCNDGTAQCDVSTVGVGDHALCCMQAVSAFDCTDNTEGAPIQMLGQRDSITNVLTGFTAKTLDIVSGAYSDLFAVPVERTTPPFTNMNACGINPIDFTMYCYVEMQYQGAGTRFLARVGRTQVHLVYRMDDVDSADIYSGTVDVDGAYITFLRSPGRYFKVDATQNLPGYADPADCPGGNTLWIAHADTADTLWHADIVSIAAANFDNMGDARWLLGITGSSQGNIGMLTKASGDDTTVITGAYHKLNLTFDLPAGQQAPTFQNNWGAAWNYYDNLVFSANDGSGVFLARIDIGTSTIHMSLVGLSDATTLNDGGNCGPPALIPFASCQARQGPLTPATVQSDCGAGWTVDTGSSLVCSFDPAQGLGCNTGSDAAADQAKCCDRDCAGVCNGLGLSFADPFDVACGPCICMTGFAGETCNQCAPAYFGVYPACVLSNAPSPAPIALPDLTIDSVERREGGLATLTVTLSRTATQVVTVDWATSDGASGPAGAQSPGDYTAASGSIAIAAGATTATILISTNTDTQYSEVSEQFLVTLTNAVNANIAGPVGTVTILNLPGVSVGDASVAEGAVATVTITRSVGANFVTTVDWTTSDGTATAAVDYTAASGTASFASGETSVDIQVATLYDANIEGSEGLFVTLSNVVDGNIDRNPGTVTILDSATVSVGDAIVPEGGLAQINVTLSRASSHWASVSWATVDVSAVQPADYVGASGTISFAPGQTNVAVYVQTTTDGIQDGDETFNVFLSRAANVSIGDGVGVVTIIDIPTVSVGDAFVQEGQTAVVQITLSHVCSQPVSVSWENVPGSATVSGGDYNSGTGTITFAPGTTVITVGFQTNLDSFVEGNEQFFVILSGATNAMIADGTGAITIIDVPAASISDTSVSEGGVAELTITLSGGSSQGTSVAWATVDGTAFAGLSGSGGAAGAGDYVGASGTVTFAPGQTSRTINILTNADGTQEGNENFSVELSSPTGCTIGDGTGVVTIIDAPTITITDIAVREGDAAVVQACLSHASSMTVSVSWQDSSGTAQSGDYASGSGVLTWAPGVLCVPISIPTNPDNEVESLETFTVVLTGPTNAAIASATSMIAIVDDPSISIGSTIVEEGEVAVVQVCLSHDAVTTVSVSWNYASGTAQSSTGDYPSGSGVLTWAIGDIRGLCLPISVPTNIDNEVEGSEHFTVVLSNPDRGVIASGTGVVLIREAPTISIGTGGGGGGTPTNPGGGGGGPGNPTTYPTGAVVTEGEVAVVPVCLSRVSGNTVTVAWSTAPGTAQSSTGDYVSSSGVITLAPGELCMNITIPTSIDGEVDTPEYFSIVLTEPTNAAVDVGTAVVVINEAPTISIVTSGGQPPSPPTNPGGGGGGGGQPPSPPTNPTGNPTAVAVTVTEGEIAVVPVCLSSVSANTISVSWTASPGTARGYAGSDYGAGGVDYVHSSGVITWVPGQLCQNILIQTNIDDEDEGEEYFTIVLSEPQNAAIAVATARVVITEIEGYGRVTGGGAGNNGGNNPGSGEGGARYNGGGGVNGGDGYGGAMGMGSYTGGGKGNGGSESGSKGMGGNDNMGGSESGGKGNSGSESGGKGNGGSKGHGGSGEGGSKGGSDKGQGGKGGSKGTDSYGAMNSASAEAGGPSSGLTIAAYVFLVAGIGLVAVRQQRERAGYSLVPSDSPNANWYNRLSLSPKRPNERTPLNLIIDAQHPALV